MTDKKQKKGKRPHQSLNDRLNDIFRKYDINDTIPVDEKIKLGTAIKNKFYDSATTREKRIFTPKKDEEQDGEVIKVLNYPAFFVPVMDAMIFDYLKQNGIYECSDADKQNRKKVDTSGEIPT